jgi:hypothetical protein
MHVYTTSTAVLCLAWTVASSTVSSPLRGILINGLSGTQIYDPFTSLHAHGHLELALANDLNAWFTVGVISNYHAYFIGRGEYAVTTADLCQVQHHVCVFRSGGLDGGSVSMYLT